jgi:hypothetical protein
METIVMRSPRRIAFYREIGTFAFECVKKLSGPSDSRMGKHFVNRAAWFLCGFAPVRGKAIECTVQACLACIGHSESGSRPGIVVAKKQSAGFLLWLEPAPQHTDLH